MPAAAPAVQPPPTLAAINRSLMSTTPLIENGSLEEASAIILQARQDIEAFARFAELPLWDTSIASLMRIAETRQAAVERRRLATQPAGEVAAGSERPADRLSVEHTRQLAAIRNDLNRIPALLRENRLADAQQALDESRDRLQVFVTATDTREWNLPVASLFQLAARRQSELEEKATAARPAGGGLGGSFLPPADARPAAAAPAANAAAQNPPPATAPALQGLAVGQPAPAFNAMTVDGRPFSLQQFKGQWVLLEFWATWCGPCLGETPNLKEVFATYGNDKRFVMISLSVDDDVAKPANYAAENELGWIQGFVGQGFNGPAMKAYQVRGIPQFFLIDPQGRIAATRIRGQRIKEAVGEALAKK